MKHHSVFAALRDVLAELYSDEASARRVCCDAGLDTRQITFSTHAVNNWTAILTEAEKQTAVANILEVAQKDYSQYNKLQSACHDYGNWLAASSVPEQGKAQDKLLKPNPTPNGEPLVSIGIESQVGSMTKEIIEPGQLVGISSPTGKPMQLLEPRARARLIPRLLLILGVIASLLVVIVSVTSNNSSDRPAATLVEPTAIDSVISVIPSVAVELPTTTVPEVIDMPSSTSTPPVAQISPSDCEGAGWNVYPNECANLVAQYLIEALVHLKAKDCDRSVVNYQTAMSLRPAVVQTPDVATNVAAAYNCRGSAFNGKGDPERAIADLVRAVELDPMLESAFINLGIAYTNRNGPDDQEQAIAALDRAIEIQIERNGKPVGGYAFFRRCIVYAMKDDYNRAIADCTQAIDLDPKYRHAYNERGLAYSAIGDYEKAIADYTKAIGIDPSSDRYYYQRALAFIELGNPDNAVGDLEKVLEISTDSVLKQSAEQKLRELKGQ